jgi:hypothetical protein
MESAGGKDDNYQMQCRHAALNSELENTHLVGHHLSLTIFLGSVNVKILNNVKNNANSSYCSWWCIYIG